MCVCVFFCVFENTLSIIIMFSDIATQVDTTMSTELVTLGQTVNLTCDYLPKDSSVSIVQWKKTVSGTDTIIDGNSDVRYSGSTITKPSLIIRNIQTGDIADYVCMVKNRIGFGSSTTITLQLAAGIQNR